MLFTWNADTIRWFCDASAHTGFHRELARLLRARLTPGGTLADLGCGAGLIDLELAGCAGHITCVDRAAEPLAYLKAEAARRNLRNLEVLRADTRALTGTWDDVIMTFHGSGRELAEVFLPLCRRQLTAVVRGGEESAFGPTEWRTPHGDLAGETRRALEAQGAVFSETPGELEYGQPLRSREDAAEFVRMCCADAPGEAVEAFLDGHLVRLRSGRWPFYLPNRKKFSIFTIPRAENEALVSRA